MQISPPEEARMIYPGQLIGAAETARLLGFDRSTLSRRIKSGVLVPLARLDGGTYVFDRSDIMAEAAK